MVLHVIELYLIVLYAIHNGIGCYFIVLHGTALYYTGLYSLYSVLANYRVVHLVILLAEKWTLPTFSLAFWMYATKILTPACLKTLLCFWPFSSRVFYI